MTSQAVGHRADSHWGLRVGAGALAGLVGGLLFGFLLSVPAVVNDAFFGGLGLLTQLGKVMGLDGSSGLHLFYVWIIHAVASVAFGVMFALVVPPSVSIRTSIVSGIAWGFALWLVGSFFLLRTWTGAPLTMDAAAVGNLVGHLVFGATLGWIYPLFDKQEEEVARQRGVSRGRPE